MFKSSLQPLTSSFTLSPSSDLKRKAKRNKRGRHRFITELSQYWNRNHQRLLLARGWKKTMGEKPTGWFWNGGSCNLMSLIFILLLCVSANSSVMRVVVLPLCLHPYCYVLACEDLDEECVLLKMVFFAWLSLCENCVRQGNQNPCWIAMSFVYISIWFLAFLFQFQAFPFFCYAYVIELVSNSIRLVEKRLLGMVRKWSLLLVLVSFRVMCQFRLVVERVRRIS